MSFFNNILEKLGLRKSNPPNAGGPAGRASPTKSTGAAGGVTGAAARPGSATQNPSTTGTATAPLSASAVDVTRHLDDLAAKNPQTLNWKTSIVDLLKLLDLDSSLTARKALADELGAPAAFKDGSAEMNLWLHRTVLAKIAENGGNVPKELID